MLKHDLGLTGHFLSDVVHMDFSAPNSIFLYNFKEKSMEDKGFEQLKYS